MKQLSHLRLCDVRRYLETLDLPVERVTEILNDFEGYLDERVAKEERYRKCLRRYRLGHAQAERSREILAGYNIGRAL
ncbi:hypothetical protein MRB53_037818 [Persea americana]|nr:hypothetical protein MRB53_037818 [Persea americana]